MSKITYPNKSTGDEFAATDANQVKTVVNENADPATDADFNAESRLLFNIGGDLKSKVASGILPYWNLKWFGAVGDGTTVDTAAFQTAMSEIPAGGELKIPEGNYIINDTIVRPGPITITGSGSRGIDTIGEAGTLISRTGTLANMFEFGYRDNNDKNGVVLKGFAVDGGETSGDDFDLIQIWNRMRHVHISDLFLRRATGRCLSLDIDAGQTGAQNTYLYANAFENSATGLDVRSAYNLNIEKCYAGFGMADGFKVIGTNQVVINNCWGLAGISNRFIELSGGSTREATITNNRATECGGTAFIVLSRPSQSGVVANNILGFESPAVEPQYGIFVVDGNNLNIHDNIINHYTVNTMFDQNAAETNRFWNNIDGKTNKTDHNNGFGQIADTESSVVINHGMSAIAAQGRIYITATPDSNESIWITDRTATTFQVNRSGTSGTLDFTWAGRCQMQTSTY